MASSDSDDPNPGPVAPDVSHEARVCANDLPVGVRGLLAIYHNLPSASLRAAALARITKLLEKEGVSPMDSTEEVSGAPDVAKLNSWKNELEKSLVFDEEIVRKFGDAADQKRDQIRAIDTLLNTLTKATEEGTGRAPAAAQTRVSSGSTPRSQAKAPAPGRTVDGKSFTPVHLYWPAILSSMIQLGGRAPKEKIIESVEHKLGGVLTPADKEMLPSGVDVRWKNRAAWQRFNMIRLGLLRRDSPRGVWEITDAGRQWLEDFLKKKTRS